MLNPVAQPQIEWPLRQRTGADLLIYKLECNSSWLRGRNYKHSPECAQYARAPSLAVALMARRLIVVINARRSLS
jgi:hypothetical protein